MSEGKRKSVDLTKKNIEKQRNQCLPFHHDQFEYVNACNTSTPTVETFDAPLTSAEPRRFSLHAVSINRTSVQGLATPDSSSGGSADRDLCQHTYCHADACDNAGSTYGTIEHVLPPQKPLGAHNTRQAVHKLQLSFRSASSDSSTAAVSKLHALYGGGGGGDVLKRDARESCGPTPPLFSSLLAASVSEAFLLPQGRLPIGLSLDKLSVLEALDVQDRLDI